MNRTVLVPGSNPILIETEDRDILRDILKKRLGKEASDIEVVLFQEVGRGALRGQRGCYLPGILEQENPPPLESFCGAVKNLCSCGLCKEDEAIPGQDYDDSDQPHRERTWRDGRCANAEKILRWRATKDNRCEVCGKAEGRLEVHHVIPLRWMGSDSNENLVLLCSKCHAYSRTGLPKRPDPKKRAMEPWPGCKDREEFLNWMRDKMSELTTQDQALRELFEPAYHSVLYHPTLSPSAKHLFWCLIRCKRYTENLNNGSSPWPGQEMLARESYLSLRTVRSCLVELQEAGCLVVEERKRASNQYTLVLPKGVVMPWESPEQEEVDRQKLPVNPDTSPAKIAGQKPVDRQKLPVSRERILVEKEVGGSKTILRTPYGLPEESKPRRRASRPRVPSLPEITKALTRFGEKFSSDLRDRLDHAFGAMPYPTSFRQWPGVEFLNWLSSDASITAKHLDVGLKSFVEKLRTGYITDGNVRLLKGYIANALKRQDDSEKEVTVRSITLMLDGTFRCNNCKATLTKGQQVCTSCGVEPNWRSGFFREKPKQEKVGCR